MSENFNELLTQMLTAYQEGKSVEEIIARQISDEGLTDEQAQNVKESVDCINDLSESYDELQRAKEDGYSRKDWLAERLEDRFKSLTEEQQSMAVEAIEKAISDSTPTSND